MDKKTKHKWQVWLLLFVLFAVQLFMFKDLGETYVSAILLMAGQLCAVAIPCILYQIFESNRIRPFQAVGIACVGFVAIAGLRLLYLRTSLS